VSSGHTHNRNGRGNQRRKHGPPRQQPQTSQSQNSQPRNGQPKQPNDERATPAMSMTALPARTEAPFQAPADSASRGGGELVTAERATNDVADVAREAEVAPPVAPERQAPSLPRPMHQRNTQPPGKRGAFLVSSERQNSADMNGTSNGHANGSQPGMQTSSVPRGTSGLSHMQSTPAEPFVVAESPAPAGPPRPRRADSDAPYPNTYAIQHGGASDADDEDADYIAHEHRALRDVRGDIGQLIDSLHELFAQDRSIASQGNATRCGICYLHYPLSELEYREVEGYYVCFTCRRALGSTPLMMLRRQQKG
jgi:hypothetical protein